MYEKKKINHNYYYLAIEDNKIEIYIKKNIIEENTKQKGKEKPVNSNDNTKAIKRLIIRI